MVEYSKRIPSKMNKTIPTKLSVTDFLETLDDKDQKSDASKLIKIFEKVTKEKPVMWGNSIIGFGQVHLKYASGRELEWLKVGFSPRKGKISLYLTFDAENLTKNHTDLGKYKIGKGCIYISKLSDVDESKLSELIETAYNEAGKNNY